MRYNCSLTEGDKLARVSAFCTDCGWTTFEAPIKSVKQFRMIKPLFFVLILLHFFGAKHTIFEYEGKKKVDGPAVN